MSVFKKLGEGVADLSELNVNTFTGGIGGVVDKASEGSVLDWDKLLADAKASGKVKLVAAVKIKFDGDSDSYYANDIAKDMLDAHLAAVEAGQKIRAGLVEMFKDVLDLK